MTVVEGSFTADDYPGSYDHVMCDAAYRCDNCHRLSVVTWRATVDDHNRFGERLEPQSGDDMLWYPRLGDVREFPDVPQHIAAAAGEATACLSIGAFRAVAMLARAIVEATAKAKGVTTGNLYEKIDKLADEGHLRATVQDAAHEVRHFGNTAAHGDDVEPATREEAEEIMELVLEILNDAFQSPARIARRRAARQASAEL